jgi:acetyltransferase-like isoleucine patch superfamily enzyme
MIILYLLKNFFISFKKGCSSFYRNAALKAKHPTGMFDLTSQIVDCDFEKYVVVFENTKLCNSRIDSYTYIQKNSTVFNAEIGKFCSIASGVSIGPGSHNTHRVSTHPSFFDKFTPLPIVFAEETEISYIKRTKIGDDVWIGERAILLDGINIGIGAVIAAGAVVTKDVAPYTIVGGVPAREINKRFSENEIEQLLASKWWLKPEKWFKDNYSYFSDLKAFLELVL